MAISFFYALVFIGSVIFCVGVVIILKRPFYDLAISAVKQLDIIFDPILTEDEKDKRLIGNLLDLIKHALLTIFLLIVVAIVSILPALLLANFYDLPWTEISAPYFYGSMILGSFVLFLFKDKSDYSYWSKLLHTIILDNYNVGRFLLKREIKNLDKIQISKEKSFVIVTGLARAGTTALTNFIYDKRKFHSISYANLPFLLAPNFWRKIYNPKTGKKRERAHGDKVLFSEKSIEAFEEYFFKVFLNDRYISEDSLTKHEIDKDILFKYYAYQDLFKQKKDTIYLAKNNNFMLRFESLADHNPHLRVFLVFRNPLDHARSLLKQHENFLLQQENDDFVLSYMDWLGHYEFGKNHKYFDFGQETQLLKYEKSSISYWLSVWQNYHIYILKILDSHNITLVSYEDLLERPSELKEVLSKILGIELDNGKKEKFIPTKRDNFELNKIENSLLEEVSVIHDELLSNRLEL